VHVADGIDIEGTGEGVDADAGAATEREYQEVLDKTSYVR
jgi:hypothetical protein